MRKVGVPEPTTAETAGQGPLLEPRLGWGIAFLEPSEGPVEFAIEGHVDSFGIPTLVASIPGAGYEAETIHLELSDLPARFLQIHIQSSGSGGLRAFANAIGHAQETAAARVAEASGSSKVDTDAQHQLHRRLSALLSAQPQELEDDTASGALAGAVSNLLRDAGKAVIHHVEKILRDEKANPEALAIALEAIGEDSTTTTRDDRLRLLAAALRSRSRWVRDGASLGLAALADRRAIPALEVAIAHEPIEDLRRDIQVVLDFLKSSR